MNSVFLAATVFLFVFSVTILLEKALIPILSSGASQPIYKEGPSWHLSKQGTPTMGGLAFVLSSLFALVLISILLINSRQKDALLSITISLIFCFCNAIIGITDDLTKLKRKKNAGLTPAQKLIFQFVFAVIFLMARKHYFADNTVIDFSFVQVNFGLLYYPIAIIILLGIINCANLTDGIDGLSSSVALTVGTVFLFMGIGNLELSLLSAILMGGAVGFLIFNAHPAKIFMGDTGSLYFGALAASCGFILNNPIISIFAGGVYVIEGISVIIQVIIFKLSGKRIFKMAPIHHHLEKCGWSENRICIVAMLFTFIFSIPIYIFYLP